MRIFTLGSADISEAEFSKILTKCQIQVVADIRLSSSRHPNTLKREVVQSVCASNRVEYLYLGNELGSQEGGGRFQVDPDLYKRGISILQSLARTRGLLILGSPHTPERCIRRKIADELAKDGAEVLHLLSLDKTWSPSDSSRQGRKPDTRFSRGPKGGKPARKPYRKPNPKTRGKSERPPLKKKTGRSKMDKIS